MPNKVQDVASNAGVTEIAEQRVTQGGSELHGASAGTGTGCKTEEEKDNCEIFGSLEPRQQCPKCGYWTKNIGLSD